MVRRPVFTLILVMVCLWGLPVFAQDAPGVDPPAHISVVDGAALLERDGRTDADLLSMPLLAGDRVRTQGGRVEVLFTDGSTLHLDANTIVDFQSDEVVRLLEGRVRLTVARAGDVAYRIDAPSAWVHINDPGEYRLAILRGGDVELAVLRGGAELVNEAGRTFVRAGERTFARAATAPSPAYVFNSAAWDAFDQWSESRRDRRLGVSAQYLPEDVRRYAPAFDAHGSWRYEQVYGYVWYPRTQVGWRPYHRGRWVSLRPYGWTWIAGDPWGWPTHHYGRWGVSAGSWFWIPGRTWAPAWVSWAYAPGYVSWCALGWNDRPVLQFMNGNVYRGRRHDPWDAWTVLPRHHFGGAYVNVSRVASVRIDPRLHNSFVIDGRAPAVHHAIGRSASPIRTAGRYSANRREVQGVGGFRSTADGATVGRDPGNDGRFPAAARTPGTASTPPSRSRDRAIGGQASSPGGRAITREARASESPSYAPSGETSGPAALAEVPRGAVAAPRRSNPDHADSGGAVSAAPYGAVRTVPRRRSDAAIGGANGPEDSRPWRRPSASAPPAASGSPAYSSPGDSSPGSSSPEFSSPRYRAAPSDRAVPRGGYEAPGYRAPGLRSIPDQPSPSRERSSGPAPRPAPERQAPAGPPPAASPSPRASGEDRQGDGGRARQSGGEGRTTGGAVRRQR